MNEPEYPAYNITFFNEQQEKPVVIFVNTSSTFSKGFVNNWTAFLFYLAQNSFAIEPHFVNYSDVNLSNARNIVLKNDGDSKFGPLFNNTWNYDFIFWIDGEIETFNPFDIFKFVGMMKMYKYVDVMTHSEDDVNNLDLKFTIFKKGIFENLSYPWFFENNKLDATFNKKLAEFKFNVLKINDCLIK